MPNNSTFPEPSRNFVKGRRSLFLSPAFLCLIFLAPQISRASDICLPKPEERRQITQKLNLWNKIRKEFLLVSVQKMPWIILFDEKCVFHINPDLSVYQPLNSAKDKLFFGSKSAAIYSASHEGKIILPDKKEISARLLSFAANYGNGKKSFLVSGMPEIWAKDEHLKEEKSLDALVDSVFVHEMTHTFHRKAHAKLDLIEKQMTGAENFDDDIIQNTFAKNDDFRKLYEYEHELLLQAVGENNLTRKRELAKAVFEAIKLRRSRFFTGENIIYGEIEEIFLTMEGAANWAAYKAAINQNLSETDALKLIRRSGKYWSQDEGIALFLVIDALLPKWQKKAFGKSQTSVTNLLAEAVK